MTQYLVFQEHSVPLLKSVTLGQSYVISKNIQALKTDDSLSIQQISDKIRMRLDPLEVFTLEDKDVLLLEVPSYSYDLTIWTGISLLKQAYKNLSIDISIISTSILAWS